MIEAIVRRWDAAISDVLGRAETVLARASVESDPLVIAADFALLGRLWTKTDAELRPFHEEISDAWNSISDELSAATPPEGVMQEQGAKRDLATCELTIRRTRAFRLVMAGAANRLKARADEQNDPALRALFEGSGARYLAERAAHEDWERMTRAQTRINGYRDRKDVPITLLKELESSARRHFTTLLDVEAEHLPLQKPYVAAKIERYMKDIEKTLRQHWQWRERGKDTT
ncbi:MAG TPA: hypothetical protein VF103_18185 [Polyangiaceae bacterium]